MNLRKLTVATATFFFLNNSPIAAGTKKKMRAAGKSSQSSGQSSSVRELEVPQEKPAENTHTIIEINDTATDEVDAPSNRPIDRIFRNPVLASGLSSGADAINKSIDSLMQSLFYSLVDNKLKWPLTGSANINLGLTREIYTARSGAYVVVDRFGIGPEYSKELYRYNNIPVTLGAYQSTDVYDIYLRTDPMRITDNKKLPWWRVAVNNWFGVLPLLEAVLPPSFNANEMYDPLNRLEAPFTFPLSVESAGTMDIGSIKSYSISGGVNLGVEIAQGIHGMKDQITTGASAIDAKLPYTVFRTGEYRINVLKKDANTLWIGLMDSNRLGHKVETKLGKTFYLLSKTIPLWRGMPAPIFPLDFGIEEAIGDIFGRVYSFDLRNDEAKTAYLEAVHGNFAPAQISWLRSREDNIDTGVSFFYKKNERRFETTIGTGHNIFVTNKHSQRTHSDAEIEITDASGKYHILEAKEDRDSKHWDMLTGGSEENITLQADLIVRKVLEKEQSGENLTGRFEFLAEGNPIDITFSLSINDKFVETEDLADYLDLLSRFAQLKVDGLPKIETRDKDHLQKRRRQVFLTNDQSNTHHLHVTPTHLGRFEGYAAARMTHDQLLAVAALPRAALWKGFCDGFKVDRLEKCMLWEKSLFWRNLYRSASIISLPMRLVDFRWTEADAVDEIENSVAALKRFQREQTPEGKQSALRALFSTDYPVERVESILELAELGQIPRSIELEAQPKGNAPDDVKNRFRKYDGHRFTSDTPFPPPARYDGTKDAESKFDPANLTFVGNKPRLKKISLFTENHFDSISLQRKNRSDADTTNLVPILVTRLSASKLGGADRVNVYVKLEQTGRVQLAKLKLIEDVIEVPIPEDFSISAPDRANFMIKLSGPQSVLANVISEESLLLGGEYKLSLAISGAGRLWSDEKSLEFRVENGQLMAR